MSHNPARRGKRARLTLSTPAAGDPYACIFSHYAVEVWAMRMSALMVCVLLSANAAAAQKLELGGTVAAACRGSDGSGCGGGTSTLAGAHASLWAANRVELTVRVARVGWDDYSYRLSDDVALDIDVTNRSRSFVSLLAVYHFREGSAVRPMFGLGSGRYSDSWRVTCRPAGCQSPQPFGPVLGEHRESDIDIIFVVGLSGTVRERWVWRGGWQSHRFGNDENMTQEFFAGLGYRVGGR